MQISVLKVNEVFSDQDYAKYITVIKCLKESKPAGQGFVL